MIYNLKDNIIFKQGTVGELCKTSLNPTVVHFFNMNGRL